MVIPVLPSVITQCDMILSEERRSIMAFTSFLKKLQSVIVLWEQSTDIRP